MFLVGYTSKTKVSNKIFKRRESKEAALIFILILIGHICILKTRYVYVCKERQSVYQLYVSICVRM